MSSNLGFGPCALTWWEPPCTREISSALPGSHTPAAGTGSCPHRTRDGGSYLVRCYSTEAAASAARPRVARHAGSSVAPRVSRTTSATIAA